MLLKGFAGKAYSTRRPVGLTSWRTPWLSAILPQNCAFHRGDTDASTTRCAATLRSPTTSTTSVRSRLTYISWKEASQSLRDPGTSTAVVSSAGSAAATAASPVFCRRAAGVAALRLAAALRFGGIVGPPVLRRAGEKRAVKMLALPGDCVLLDVEAILNPTDGPSTPLFVESAAPAANSVIGTNCMCKLHVVNNG